MLVDNKINQLLVTLKDEIEFQIFQDVERLLLKIFFSKITFKSFLESEIERNNEDIISFIKNSSENSRGVRLQVYARLLRIKEENFKISKFRNLSFENVLNGNSDTRRYFERITITICEMLSQDRSLDNLIDEDYYLNLINFCSSQFSIKEIVIDTSENLENIERRDLYLANNVKTLISIVSKIFLNIYYIQLTERSENINQFMKQNSYLFKNIELQNTIKGQSYQWKSSNPKSLNNFYKLLIREKLLKNHIDYEGFKKFFNNEPLNNLENNILLNFNTSEIIFLVYQLMLKKYIDEESNWSWIRFTKVFGIDSSPDNLKVMKKELIDSAEIKKDKPTVNKNKILNILKSID